MSAFDTPEAMAAIRDAVKKAEQNTCAEIVPVIALRSDTYRYIPALVAAVLALSVPLPLTILGVSSPVLGIDLFEAQLLLFMVIAVVLQFTPWRYTLVPLSVRRRRAARMAREQFVEQGVHLADGHMGVLIFVSVAERYIEVLVDEGLADMSADADWQLAVDDFTSRVKAGRITEAYKVCIEDIAKVLAEKAPALPDQPTRNLDDRLVVIR